MSPVPTTARRMPSPGSRRAHQLGDAESEVERLAAVETRVAQRLVAAVELFLAYVLGAADALGHVLAGELDVDPTGPVPIARCAAKKPSSSAMIASKCRVFVPEGVSTVLAYIGSHTQATGISALRIASRSGGRRVAERARSPCATYMQAGPGCDRD